MRDAIRNVLNSVLGWLVGLLLNASVDFETRRSPSDQDAIEMRIVVKTRTGDFPSEWFKIVTMTTNLNIAENA